MNGRFPTLDQQQLMVQKVMDCYMSLLPVVAASVLAGPTDPSYPNMAPCQIADQAWRITMEAMKKIGIQVPESAPEP